MICNRLCIDKYPLFFPAQIPPLFPLRSVHTLHICALLLPQCSGFFCRCSTAPHGAHACISLQHGAGALSPVWGLPGGCQEQHCGTVRQCLCPIPPSTRAVGLSCGVVQRKKPEMVKSIACNQLPYTNSLLAGFSALNRGAMGGVSAMWQPLVSVLSQLFLYQPCLVVGQEQFTVMFFKLAGKLLLQTPVP